LRAVGVVVLAQYPAHVDGQVGVFVPDCPHGLYRLVQMGPGGGDVTGAQGVDAGDGVQGLGNDMVAGSLDARDGLGEQWRSVRWLDVGVAEQVIRETLAEQDIIAELPGALDSLLSGGESSLRLAGQVAQVAEGGEGFDEEPVGAGLPGDCDRLLPPPQRCRYVNEASREGGGDQRLPEQRGIGPGSDSGGTR